MFVLAGAPAAAATDVTYRCGEAFANLCRVDVAAKKVTRLTRDGQPGGPRYRDVSVSRSGRRHAFLFGNDLFVSGRTPRRAAGPRLEGVVFAVRMRPDGRQVAFTKLIRRGPVSFRGLFTIGVTTRSAAQSVADSASVGWLGGRLLRPEFDPEIGEFASQKICLLATNDDFACERDVAIDPSRDLIDPEGSPDGRFVVATAVPAQSGVFRDGGRIALFSAADGNLVRYLTSGPADSRPSFSPGGKRVVFASRGSLRTVARDGGRPRLLVRRGISPSWSR